MLSFVSVSFVVLVPIQLELTGLDQFFPLILMKLSVCLFNHCLEYDSPVVSVLKCRFCWGCASIGLNSCVDFSIVLGKYVGVYHFSLTDLYEK